MDDHEHDGRVTYRELMAMFDALRKEIDARFETHYTRHEKDIDLHETLHERENERRTGYIRWAVTTLMTGAGVLIALYAALGRG